MDTIETLQYTRAADLPGTDAVPARAIDITPYLGRWVNTNRSSKGITSFTLAVREGRTFIHASAANAPFDWGEQEATLYSSGVEGSTTSAFNAVYGFGFAESFLAANLNAGLIIIAAYTRFNDESGRSNYFSREFYFHDKQPG
jgi:hypothetical protein